MPSAALAFVPCPGLVKGAPGAWVLRGARLLPAGYLSRLPAQAEGDGRQAEGLEEEEEVRAALCRGGAPGSTALRQGVAERGSETDAVSAGGTEGAAVVCAPLPRGCAGLVLYAWGTLLSCTTTNLCARRPQV